MIYEVHVRGFTKLHPEIPEELRGTYAGMAHPAAIAYLKDLGVTAVELLPVHEATDDGFLEDRSLRNYWGYSTLGYFAPEQRYGSGKAPGSQVAEFKGMVKALYAAGIEVLLDVVYNHTCEGNHLGPTLSLRGIDNSAYYWLMPEPRYYAAPSTLCLVLFQDAFGTRDRINTPGTVDARNWSVRLPATVDELNADAAQHGAAGEARRRGGPRHRPQEVTTPSKAPICRRSSESSWTRRRRDPIDHPRPSSAAGRHTISDQRGDAANAARIRPTWEYACGKFPHIRRLVVS